jgi:transposase-like protein
MGGRIRYREEFKLIAVAQVTAKYHSVTSVARWLSVSTKSLYDWVKRYGGALTTAGGSGELDEIKQLKTELKRVTEGRDILKKGHGVLRKEPRVKYAFIKAHRTVFSVRAMCRVLGVHASGFYAWLKNGLSD